MLLNWVIIYWKNSGDSDSGVYNTFTSPCEKSKIVYFCFLNNIKYSKI